MDKVFISQIKRNIQIYMYNIMIMSAPDDLIPNLEETFAIAWRYSMKLNSEKCIFEVWKGKFLEYLVTERDIEANPQKIEVMKNI